MSGEKKMPFPELVKKISENSSSQVDLIINEPALTDKEFLQLIELLKFNTHINKISIPRHSLTKASYEPMLRFLQSRPMMINFSCKLIMPPSVYGSMYNGSIQEVLEENRKLLLSESEKSISPSSEVTRLENAEEKAITKCSSQTSAVATKPGENPSALVFFQQNPPSLPEDANNLKRTIPVADSNSSQFSNDGNQNGAGKTQQNGNGSPTWVKAH